MALIATALVVSASPASGTTWIVYPSQGSIPPLQTAIKAAAPGDTLLAMPGMYFESVNFMGKPLHLMSSGGAQVTFLEPASTSAVTITIHDTPGESSITGFTIRNGFVGVSVHGAEVLIQENVITTNTGGGLSCSSSLSHIPLRVTIRNNTFEDNQARTVGGAVLLWAPDLATVDANVFRNNSCASGDGGAICALATYGSTFLICNNIITNNHAADHGGGICLSGIVNDTGQVFRVEHNLIADNQADGVEQTGGSGGGIWIASARGSISENTIVRNSAPGNLDFLGGNLAIERPLTLSVTRNIIALATVGRGLYCAQVTSLDLADNLFWGNTGGPASAACLDLVTSNGNLQGDPLFCDPETNNFTLQGDSPAISAPSGPMGAFPEPGCSTPIQLLTWGRLKQMFSTSIIRSSSTSRGQ